MNKSTSILIGPEIIWIVYYLILLLVIRLTQAPNKSLDSLWIALIYIIPLVLLPLTFGLYYVPGVVRSWLLLRLWIAGLVGCHVVIGKALLAHSEQGPGVGMAYIMGMGFALFVLVVGSVWALIKF